MKFYLGVTDNNWFRYLSRINPEDVNFWQPGGSAGFRVLTPGAPFLFKLKSPLNAIGGIGFFSSHTFLPISVAWETFGNRNGCDTFLELTRMIMANRHNRSDSPIIGCIVLTNPIFFRREDWIDVPRDWSKNIVQGKSYDTESGTGRALWNQVEARLEKYLFFDEQDVGKSQLLLEASPSPYSKLILTRVRLGQGAFRVLVTDAYKRRCAITGERTLPALEAAHIKPYASSGPHFISNGLLVRSDIHKLFDTGYITVTPGMKVEVSSRIKQEFENGREYYQFHGKGLACMPERRSDIPDGAYLEWHNENIYRG